MTDSDSEAKPEADADADSVVLHSETYDELFGEDEPWIPRQSPDDGIAAPIAVGIDPKACAGFEASDRIGEALLDAVGRTFEREVDGLLLIDTREHDDGGVSVLFDVFTPAVDGGASDDLFAWLSIAGNIVAALNGAFSDDGIEARLAVERPPGTNDLDESPFAERIREGDSDT